MTTHQAHNGSGGVNGELGRRIDALRDAAGMTQGQLAAALGLTQASVSRKLSGERPWFAGELVEAARVLHVTVGELFGELRPAPLKRAAPAIHRRELMAV